MEIKIKKSGFTKTKSAQQKTIADLRASYNRQQAAFGEVGYTWEGTGGDSFRNCAGEMNSQSLMGILMITSLNTQTQTSQNNFEETDRGSSGIMTR